MAVTLGSGLRIPLFLAHEVESPVTTSSALSAIAI